MLTDDEAAAVGAFRRFLDRASLAELSTVAATTLDSLIEVLRGIDRGGTGVEMAAALAAELHKRWPPAIMAIPATRAGNA